MALSYKYSIAFLYNRRKELDRIMNNDLLHYIDDNYIFYTNHITLALRTPNPLFHVCIWNIFLQSFDNIHLRFLQFDNHVRNHL